MISSCHFSSTVFSQFCYWWRFFFIKQNMCRWTCTKFCCKSWCDIVDFVLVPERADHISQPGHIAGLFPNPCPPGHGVLPSLCVPSTRRKYPSSAEMGGWVFTYIHLVQYCYIYLKLKTLKRALLNFRLVLAFNRNSKKKPQRKFFFLHMQDKNKLLQ